MKDTVAELREKWMQDAKAQMQGVQDTLEKGIQDVIGDRIDLKKEASKKEGEIEIQVEEGLDRFRRFLDMATRVGQGVHSGLTGLFEEGLAFAELMKQVLGEIDGRAKWLEAYIMPHIAVAASDRDFPGMWHPGAPAPLIPFGSANGYTLIAPVAGRPLLP